jgi:hypothetical protein
MDCQKQRFVLLQNQVKLTHCVILSGAKNLSDVGKDASLGFFLPLVVRMTASLQLQEK